MQLPFTSVGLLRSAVFLCMPLSHPATLPSPWPLPSPYSCCLTPTLANIPSSHIATLHPSSLPLSPPAAAVGKGFSPYFCTMIGVPPTSALLITKGAGGAPLEIDLVAFGIIIVISALLAYGMKEAAWVNTVVTVVVIAVVCFTFITGRGAGVGVFV